MYLVLLREKTVSSGLCSLFNVLDAVVARRRLSKVGQQGGGVAGWGVGNSSKSKEDANEGRLQLVNRYKFC